MDCSVDARLNMNVLEINCLSPGHSWLQADAHHESVLCVCPRMNLTLLYRDVNMFLQVKTTFLLQHNINALYHREWKQERERGIKYTSKPGGPVSRCNVLIGDD